ncbi:SDR family oxidoreductase [Alkalimarinus sediminis]|uniref:SDR family oxidoreductase n=1 Tax=Alkalimarinus sediminis TaxID=1632866 RepID=A0A9E8HF92_9ALTE|nr:SDR family oxidoreductase [Alkalimarinus sediminis]UZW73558.1 SDR family oxidoreductase [Alkalimarinus sediminis]
MNDEVIWLTGCASGVGLHLTGAFLKRGYRVVASDINIGELERLANHHNWDSQRVLVCHLDITSLESWESAYQQTISQWGRVDRLLNIAGYLKPGFIHETSKDEIDRHIDINVKGLIIGSQLLARHMVKSGHGHIINIASLAGVAPIPGISLYSTSKFAVRGFSLALAQELKEHNVKVTVICPDAIQTPMLDLQEDYDEAVLTFSGPEPLTVDDIEQSVFNDVIPNAPLEISLPKSRGVLAKLGNAFPATTLLIGDILAKKGKKAQQKRKAKQN